jgi:hypothetical protein
LWRGLLYVCLVEKLGAVWWDDGEWDLLALALALDGLACNSLASFCTASRNVTARGRRGFVFVALAVLVVVVRPQNFEVDIELGCNHDLEFAVTSSGYDRGTMCEEAVFKMV